MAREFEILNAKINVNFDKSATLDDIKDFNKNLQVFIKKLNSGELSMVRFSNAIKSLQQKASYESVNRLSVELKNAAQHAKVASDSNGKLNLSLSSVQKAAKTAVISLEDYYKKLNAIDKSSTSVKDYNTKIKELQQQLSADDINIVKNTERIKNEIRRAEDAAYVEDRKRTAEKIKAIEDDKNASIAKAAKVQTLSGDINRISEDYLKFNRTTLQVFSDFRNGIEIFRTGQNSLTALRSIFTSVSDSTSITARTFDTLSNISNTLSNNRLPRLEKALKKTASQAVLASQASVDLVNRFKELAKEESGINKANFNELAKSASRSSREFSNLQRVIATTGNASQAQIDRVSEELTRSLNVIKLNESEYNKLGTEGKRVFNELKKAKETEIRLLHLMSAQSKSFKDEHNKITVIAREQGITFEEAAKKSSNSFLSFFNIFKRGKIDVQNLNKEVNKTDDAIDKASKSAGNFSLILSGLTGGLIGGGLVTAIPRVFDALKNKITGSVQAASDANEEMSKFAVVFDSEVDPAIGEADSLVQDMITRMDGLAEELGRSKYELRAFAAQFQDTFVPLGFAREEAAKLSYSLVELTQNLSSFYNMNEKEVADRISSFLVGNYENARAFGVIVNDAALNAELLAMGIKGGTRAVDQQVKSLTALKLLYSGTADAEDDVIRTSSQFANMMREIQGAAKDAAVEFGSKLLPVINPLLASFIRIKNEIGPSISNIFTSIYNAIVPLSEVFVSVINGATSLEDFKIVVYNALVGVMDTMNSFIPEAANWAWAWGVEIYNGLIDVASSLIAEAASFVGSIISSFLEPGSPPEQGPLSTIDKWGVGLMSTFSEGFQSSKVDLLTEILGPVSNALSGSGKTKEFQDIKNGLADIIEEATSVGEVDSTRLNDLLSGTLDEQQIKETEAVINEKAKLAKLQSDLDKAKTLGDYKQISSLKARVSEQESVVSELEARLAAEDKLQSLESKVEKTRQQNAKNLANAAAAAAKSMDKYKKTAQEVYEEEIENAQAIYDEKVANADSEEQRLEALLELKRSQAAAEKKLIKSTQGEERSAAIERLAAIEKEGNAVKDKLAEIRKSAAGGSGASGKLTLADLGLDVEDFLSQDTIDDFYARTSGKVKEVSQKLVNDAIESAYIAIGIEEVTLKDKMVEWFTSGITGIKEYVQGLEPSQILPFSALAGVMVVGFGALLSPILAPIIGLLGTLASTVAGLALPFAAAAAAGYGLYLVFTNWDSIMSTLSSTFETLKEPLSTLATNAGAFIEGLFGRGRVNRWFGELELILRNVIGLFGDFIGLIFSSASGSDFTGFVSSLVTKFNEFLDSLGGAEAVGNSLGRAIENILFYINDLIKSARALVTGDSAFNPSGPLGAIVSIILSIRNTFVNAFSDIFSNSDLFSSTWLALKELFIGILPILKAVGLIIGTVIVVAIDLLISAFEGVIAALPFIIDGFSGIMNVIEGVGLILQGFGQYAQGVVLLIKGLFTGDLAPAIEAFRSATESIGEGISTILQGALRAISNFGIGIITFIYSTILSFVANLAGFFGDAGQEIANGLRQYRDDIVDGFYEQVNTVETTLDQLTVIIPEYMKRAYDSLVEWVASWLDPFYNFYDEVVGNSIIPDTVSDIVWYIAGLGPSILSEIASMLPDLISGFLNLGKELLSNFISGIGDGSLVTQGLDIIKGLFSGGQDQSVSGPTVEDSNQFGTTITSMSTAFNNFITGIKTEVTNTDLLWSNFSLNIYTLLLNSIIALEEPLLNFFTTLQIRLTDAKLFVTYLIDAFSLYGTIVTEINSDTKSGFGDNVEALEELEKIVKQVTKAYEKMYEAAKKAIGAANDAIGSSGLEPIDSYKVGTDYVPKTGIYHLHKGEAVLTAGEALKIRNLLSNTDARVPLLTKLNNAMNATQNVNNNTKQANIQINANYLETKSRATIKDDVYTGLRLAGYGI